MMRERLAYLLKTYLLTLAIFVSAKMVFMLCYHGEQAYTADDMGKVVWYGLSLDLSTALYIIAIPLLVTIVSVWTALPRWMLKPYYALIAATMSLAFVADTSLYEFWHFKLDAFCLTYLDTPVEAMASVSAGYIAVRILLFAVVAVIIYCLYSLTPAPWQRPSPGTRHPGFRHALTETLAYVLLIPFIVIGIRGGVGESTTNIGQVYFSQNQFLNHAAVNPVFSFVASLDKTGNDIPIYHFMSAEECQKETEGLFPTVSIGSDTLLNTMRPNIIIILLESCGDLFAPVMPRLQQLKREGISFTHCYANSWRTDRGTLCTWSGYPSFPTTSVMKMPTKTRLLPSIALSLQNEGYNTTYLYGGDINFTNMHGYLIDTGFENIVWQKDFTIEEQFTSQWGVHDHITFDRLFNMATSKPSPYLIGFSTLSTHEPWTVPLKKHDDEMENAFAYLDNCIGDFVDSMKNTPQWNDLLIVLLPDHSIDHYDMNEHNKERNRIPLVWIGGAVKEPRSIDAICNQTDLPATLLGQMRLPHDAFRFSRDVMSSNYTQQFAIHTYNNAVSMTDSTGFAVYDLDINQTVVAGSEQAEEMVKRGKAILQLASEDLKNME